MSESLLSSVTTGKRQNPIFVVLYGVDGVGKNTFAASAPKPIFISIEEKGSDHLNVARLPHANSMGLLTGQLKALGEEKHDYQTAVIDSLDFIEPMIYNQVCKEGNCETIVDYKGGYGKGFERARELWRRLLEVYITPLSRKMNVVMIAHCQIKTFADPAQPTGYDRYQLKINEKSVDIIREVVDCVLFATYDITVVKEKGDKKGRGVGDGERVMYTERRPAFDAKNRFDLPFEMPLKWEDFQTAIETYYNPKSEPKKASK